MGADEDSSLLGYDLVLVSKKLHFGELADSSLREVQEAYIY
jgi:hypothetical protein